MLIYENFIKTSFFNLFQLTFSLAKSVILMGLNKVHIFETKPNISYIDLSTQFYCKESDIDSGKTRAEISLPQLRKLNPFCDIELVSDTYFNGQEWENDLYKLIPSYNVVVFTDFLLHDLAHWDQYCRSNGTAFIACETRGVFGSIFNDFGDKFTVVDLNGENPQNGLIINLETDEEGNGVIDFHDEENEKPLKLFTGDKIRIFNVDGMEELNGQIREIERTEMWKFKIGKIDNLSGAYKGGGYFEEVKSIHNISFSSLQSYIENIGFNSSLEYDSGKLDYPPQIEIAYESLNRFIRLKSGKSLNYVHSLIEIEEYLPRSYNEEDAFELLSIAQTIAKEKNININEDIFKNLSYTSRGQLNPVTTFIGGIVGQEIQKAVTGKFNPIRQSFHWECMDIIPNPLPKSSDIKTLNSRYDGQIAVFGNKFQKLIGNLNYFMIGAGALGCEFLKNFALMGLGCGPKGKIIVTDMDTIEVSNLSRQFLFNEQNVGQMKSRCACEAAQSMNPNLNCVPLSDRVGLETEDTFNEKFWQSLTGVVTALDNVAARKYVDEKCVQYKKPMIDSGTLGPSSHVQVVSPLAKTECYRSKKEPETIEFAFCTIHYHPNIIEHTITWAKNYFAGVFNSGIQEVNSFLKDPQAYLNSEDKGYNVMSLETIYGYLIKDRPRYLHECVQWARQQYENLFNYGIQNVLLTYPTDKKTSSGSLFWTGAKRCPTPIQFSPDDEMSIMFIESASRLYGSIFGIEFPKSINWPLESKAITVQPYIPNPVKDESKDSNQENQYNSKMQQEEFNIKQQKHIEFMRKALQEYAPEFKSLPTIEFEKDDDTNFHIEFITSASNLRARAYRIPESDMHKTKGIAGNIIPAMITTTALTTGLVCTELYKIIQNKSRTELRDAFINLAFPSFQQWEPKEASIEFAGRFTLWDQFIIDEGEDITLSQIISIIKERYAIESLGFTYQGNVLWSIVMDEKMREARSNTPLAKMIQFLQQKKFPASQSSVQLSVTGYDISDPNSEILEQLPSLIYYFKKEKSVNEEKLIKAKARASLIKKRAK